MPIISLFFCWEINPENDIMSTQGKDNELYHKTVLGNPNPSYPSFDRRDMMTLGGS